ncbi:MLt-TeN (mlt-10) related [Caenorhabditis elegans]|uniref:MLt-TeN (Mlt-10) related n=1 Tax=Caenorhabditis elegans TaxID=6239 RepID=Q7YX27_CAEEL|nr:MLt-TeN (mlt-10) related [Caenorhabditis elegans]CAE17803.3 MLt-TeN (mlt-10) related [Caenorhabditis elegans]|eukprot:NP_001022099.2 MLt-TeN (mlt-10) related [Caenorhabditis elegans]
MAIIKQYYLLLLLFVSFYFVSTASTEKISENEIPESLRSQLLTIPEKQKLAKIHYDWYGYSLKRLMVQLGKSVLKNLDLVGSNKFLSCLKKVKKSEKSEELENIARCLTRAKMKEAKLRKLGWKRKIEKPIIPEYHRRSKRSYRLKEEPRFYIKSQSSYNLKDPPSSPISKFSNLLLTLLKNTTSSEAEEKWASTFRRMKRMNKNLEKSRSSTYRTIKHRAYDLVLEDDDDVHAENPFEMAGQVNHPLIQDGLKLVSSMAGNQKTGISARILSPRIAPLMPSNSKGLLSPSIFPFYKDDVEEQFFPIPDLIEKSSFEKSEKDRLLAFFMEISRTRPILDEAMKMIKLLNPEKQSFSNQQEKEAVLSATDNMSQNFENLEKSLSKNQKTELKESGFSFLEMPQMENLFGNYGADSTLQKPEMQSYRNYTKSERMLSLWKSIENIAYPVRRVKRGRTIRVGDVTVYTSLNPTVFTPYMFSPVYGLSVLGPVIFSPNIFSPLILNPSVLSPWIFSPAVPLPFILSPYLLSPYIFSPLVMAPFILNPYVLSPNIFNPYVLSPLVLSPLFLCPDVFSPMVLGGVILSPNSFSPAVFSKSYIMATVLSPTVLS